MKSNVCLTLLLIYVAMFGIPVHFGEPTRVQLVNQCKPIEVPVISPLPKLPKLDKDDIANKDYVIRLLIGHIKKQEQYAHEANKQIDKIYKTYAECSKR